MSAYIALFRGLNVGTGNRIKMADLRACLNSAGLDNVATILASGNVAFNAADANPETLATLIFDAVRDAYDIQTNVIVKSAADVDLILRENPISVHADLHSKLLVIFAQDPKLLEWLEEDTLPLHRGEQFAIGTQAAYLFCIDGISRSEAAEIILGKHGKDKFTTRNLKTTIKIQALARKLPV